MTNLNHCTCTVKNVSLCTKTNSLYQVAAFGRGSASYTKTWNDCRLSGNVGKFVHCKLDSTSWNSLEAFKKFSLSCNSCICECKLLWKVAWLALNSSPGEFVNLHFLSSLQFFHFMDVSDATISKCFFSLNQFFVKSSLLSSRFFIPIIHVIHFQTIGIELVFEIHECKCWEYQLYILASRFPILFLRVDDHFVLQELFSQLLPDQRIWRKFHLFPELFDVPRKCLSLSENVSWLALSFMWEDCGNFFPCTFFSEMKWNWTLSFLGKSVKLVIGQHLFVSPVSPAVKPAYSEFDHRPNPIQEEVFDNALGCNHQVDVMLGLVGEHRFDQHVEVSSSVRSLGSWPVGECVSAKVTERHIRWICAGWISMWSGHQWRSGRRSGRRSDWSACGKWGSAQVWRKEQRGRVWHAVQDAKNDSFVRHNDPWLDDSSLEPKREKSRVRECDVCVGLVLCLHLPSLTRESTLPKSETPWLWDWKREQLSWTPTWCLWPWRRLPPGRRLPSWGKRACWWTRVVPPLQPVFGSTRSEPSSCQANGWPGRCRTCSLGWSLVLALPDSWCSRSWILSASW